MSDYSKRKKILRIANTTGAIANLLKGQLKYLSESYEVVVVAPNGQERKEIELREGVRFIPLDMQRRFSPFRDLISLIKLMYILIRESPDIIHSITPKAGFLAMIAGGICGVPIRMHTFTGLLFPTSNGIKKTILKLADKVTCVCATNVYGEGYGVKNDLERFHITTKQIKVLANGNINGIDLEYYKPEAIKHDVFTYIFCGRIVGDKGMNELSYAFKKIVKQYHNVKLLLVGMFEDDLDPILPIAKEFFLTSPNVSLVSWQKDIRPFLNSSDVLVFPSYREGFPNIVLQAQAVGLPAIVSNINGCNEIIRNNENGWIIPPKDEVALYERMCEVYIHRNELIPMKERCRQVVEKYFNNKFVWSALKMEYELLVDSL